MTGVILRCPNCGTSTSTTGECEACHEAQVRYYCTSHKPGRWLDESACPQCGAKFGDPVRRPSRRAPAAAPPRSRTTPAPPTPPRAHPRPSPWSHREREGSPASDRGEGDKSVALRGLRTARMLEIFRAASRTSRMSPRATYTAPATPPVGAALGGCLMRFVILAMFLVFMFVLMLSFVGGSLFELFSAYYF